MNGLPNHYATGCRNSSSIIGCFNGFGLINEGAFCGIDSSIAIWAFIP